MSQLFVNAIAPVAPNTTLALGGIAIKGPVYDITHPDFGAVDGQDASSALAEAYAAVVAKGGGTVYVPRTPTGFLVNSTVDFGSTQSGYVTITGGGRLYSTGDNRIFRSTGGQRLIFDSLLIDGQATGAKTNQNLIEIASATDVTVQRCRLLNCGVVPIRVDTSTQISIVRNTINTTYDNGIWVTNTNDIGVLFNRFLNVGALSALDLHGTGIEFSVTGTSTGIAGFRIIGNYISNANRLGIELFNDLTDPTIRVQRGSVTNNVVEQTRTTGNSTGISLAGALDVTVANNSTYQGAIGVEVAFSSRCAVTGNVARGSGTTFALNGGADGGCTDVTVTGNIADRPVNAAFQINGTGHDNITITGNVGRGAGGSTSARGVFFNACQGGLSSNTWFTCTGNVMKGFGQSGFYWLNSWDGIVANNIGLGNNTSATVGEDNFYFNLDTQAHQDLIRYGTNVGSMQRPFQPLDSQASGLLVQGGFKYFQAAVTNTGTNFAHGLGYTPNKVLFFPRGNAVVWQSAAATSTNVNLQASVAGPTNVDVYVA